MAATMPHRQIIDLEGFSTTVVQGIKSQYPAGLCRGVRRNFYNTGRPGAVVRKPALRAGSAAQVVDRDVQQIDPLRSLIDQANRSSAVTWLRTLGARRF